MAHNCQTSMRLNCGVAPGNSQLRRSVANKPTLNQERSLVASVKLLDNPDVRGTVKVNIANQQILVWDSSDRKFVNESIATVVSGVGLSKRVREFFIKGSGDNADPGDSVATAVKDLEIAIEGMSKVSTTYEMVQFWVVGDVVFNTGNFNGIIRDGVLGNNRRGVSIRGVPTSINWTALTASDGPRTGGGLSHGIELISGGALNAGQLTAIADSTDVSNKLNSWAAGVDLKPETVFLKAANDKIYPVVVDETTTADPNGVQATTLRRLYLVTSASNPVVSEAYEQWGFTSKITCTDLDGDGLGADAVKPGWSVTGNVQFTEIHVAVKDEVTPVNINGQFQILYSMFSNLVSEGTAAALLLSSGGVCDNADATAETVGNAVKESTRTIQVYKSVFRDLNILVDSPCHFKDCVFYRCSFVNPRGATCESCLFYNSRPHVLGDNSIQNYLQNTLSLHKCMVVYGTTGSFATCQNQSSIVIEKVLARPMKTNGDQNVPFLMLHEGSSANIDGLYIPANSGLNATGTLNNKAVVASCVDSQITAQNLKIISTGVNECSILLTQNSTNVVIGDMDDATVNGGPLLTARDCAVRIQNFDVTLDAAYVLAQATEGYFNLHSCNVSVSPVFELNGAASTNEILFNLHNTKLLNTIGTVVADNKFSLINNKIKKLFHISHNSDVTITTGSPASILAGAQKDLVGRCSVDYNSKLQMTGTDDDSWNVDWSENINWKMDDGGNGFPVFQISNGSYVGVHTINLDVSEGGTQSGGQRSKLATLVNSSRFDLERSKVDITGHNTAPSLSAKYNSHVHLGTCKVNIRTGSGAPLAMVTHNSSLIVTNDVPGTAMMFEGAGADKLVDVNFNSRCDFRNMSMTAGTSCLAGIIANNGSSVSFTAAVSNPSPIIFTGSTGPNDPFFSVGGNSKIDVENVTFAPVAAGGQLLFAKGLCRCYLNGVNKSGGNVPDKAVTIEDGTTLYVGSTSNDMPVQYGVGTVSTARQTITKSALDSQHVYPQQSEIGSKWDDLRGCMIIKS